MSTTLRVTSSLSPGINLITNAVENLEDLVFDTNMIYNQIEKNSFGTHSGICFLWALRRTSNFYSRLLTGAELPSNDFLEKCGKFFCRLTIVPIIGIALKISAVALWALAMTAASLERFIIKAKDGKEIWERQNAFKNVIRKDKLNDYAYRFGLLNEAFRNNNQLGKVLPEEHLF